MTDKAQELTVVERIDPSITISKAVEQGADKDYLETLKGLFELQLRNEENEARKAFFADMAIFKANPPKIYRDLQVKYEVGNKTTEWTHADLGVAADAINIALGENGLNATWRTETGSGDVKVTCVIAHKSGHTEETSMSAPPDKTGSKNEIQAIASTIFYLERYTLFAMTGTAPTRMDDDGMAGGATYITEDQQAEIAKGIKDTDYDEKTFLDWIGAASIETISESQYKTAIQGLEEIKGSK